MTGGQPNKWGREESSKFSARRQKANKPVSRAWLERAALHYLGRFSASEARLREILLRKIRRRSGDDRDLTKAQKQDLDDVVGQCVKLGYIDDASYARSRAEVLVARGKTRFAVERDLSAKGVDQTLITRALASLEDDETIEYQAFVNYLRRRRFGPFASMSSKPKPQDKQFAAIMRAGFSYELAKISAEADSETCLLALLDENRR